MIRVFVGCAANGEDVESQAVFEYTLRSRASEPVEITWMQLSRTAKSPFYSDVVGGTVRGWQTALWSTPFSGFRWAVPELAGFSGRAVYADSDVIWRGDIAELYREGLKPGKFVVAKGGADSWRFCVSLWDCEAARRAIPPVAELQRDPRAHRSMVEKFRHANWVQPFSTGNWNCIDGEDYKSLTDPDIKAIHYSSEAHQPQLRHAIPRLAGLGRRLWFDGEVKPHWRHELVEMFDAELVAAEQAGYFTEDYAPPKVYGAYRKMSHSKGYRTHRYAPAGA